jgi:hypothetical protein
VNQIRVSSCFFPQIPRFNFGINDNFRTYNLLVWKFGSSFEFYLGFYLGGFKFESNSNLNQFKSLKEIGKRYYAERADNQPTGPRPLSAHWPAQRTARTGQLPRAAHRTLPSGATLRHADVVVVILALSPLADDERPKRGCAGHGRRRDAPRDHPAHPCRPRTPRATAAIRSRRRDPHGSPNPSRLGGSNLLPTYPQAGGEGEGEEKEEDGGTRSSTTRRQAGAAREEPDPREPSTPATPCFLGFPFTASSICFHYQRRLLPRHRAAHPFTDAYASASGHPGEDAVSSPLWTPWPSSRGRTPAAPPLVMPAIEPGWDAIFCRRRRLRRRARHSPSLPL